MKVLYVTSTLHPLTRTGCVDEVCGMIPPALVQQGADVRILLPAYPEALKVVRRKGKPIDLGNPLGLGVSRLIPGWLPEGTVKVWLLECPAQYEREGGPFLDSRGIPWPDNGHRFALLSKVAALLAEAGGLLGWQPDILHANDWPCGLAPAYLALNGNRQCGTVFTVRDLRQQGNFDRELLHRFGLPKSAFTMNGLEFFDQLSFLKAGLYYANKIITPSPTWSREIQLKGYGEGMHGVCSLRGGDLSGILNGLDEEEWNPATDPLIPFHYDANTLDDKLHNKLEIQRAFNLEPNPDIPLIGMVSSLDQDEGGDLLVAALSGLISAGAQLIVVGRGDEDMEHSLVMASTSYPGRIGVRLDWERGLHHRILAGADLLLIPARFDPCAVRQYQAMRYGALPVVRKTGGLADTVMDCLHGDNGTGFVFNEASGGELMLAISRGINLFRNRVTWRRHQVQAMNHTRGWQESAKNHLQVYHRARPL
ncbi:MAG: glycogen synthase GlgA [Magnetococcales bacterium]|nr:glycogen synthase GlgA [Magnetococcales bacterium]MBF0149031.1 glycogen synthase GlgA [Magnetococcales bacterium]MBF0172080.1 glycogen synthase GlgA [Magnetococcales bacterium]MBF0346192.1 glycogen synthase GlgA [Magnetococcales bacterium]MBF0630315.1 glycogen synthase GlgA [Magnetococcales bacterium]